MYAQLLPSLAPPNTSTRDTPFTARRAAPMLLRLSASGSWCSKCWLRDYKLR
jgi:hypothetical protein